jgi:hypothetical protein
MLETIAEFLTGPLWGHIIDKFVRRILAGVPGWCKVPIVIAAVAIPVLLYINKRRETNAQQAIPAPVKEQGLLLVTLSALFNKHDSHSFQSVFLVLGNGSQWFPAIRDEVADVAKELLKLLKWHKQHARMVRDDRRAWRIDLMEVVSRIERACIAVGQQKTVWQTRLTAAEDQVLDLARGYDLFRHQLDSYAQRFGDAAIGSAHRLLPLLCIDDSELEDRAASDEDDVADGV